MQFKNQQKNKHQYPHKNKDKGYVLLIILIFIQFLSCLGLYALQLTTMTTKANHHLWIGKTTEIKANKQLKELESRINEILPLCTTSIIPPVLLAQKPIEWWQLYACREHKQGILYYFVIEIMDRDDCAVISVSRAIAQYYRITLLAQPDKLRGSKYILQSTVAMPAAAISIRGTNISIPARAIEKPGTAIAIQGQSEAECQDKIHAVKTGRQSWRALV